MPVRPTTLGGVPQIPEKVHELTVGQLSARSGAAVSALHFYETKGLITSRRTAGNQRRYTRDALRRVAFVRAAQRVGIPSPASATRSPGSPKAAPPTARTGPASPRAGAPSSTTASANSAACATI